MGMLSVAGILCWHLKQWDGGETIDLPAGRRSAITLMKLPKAAPIKKNRRSHKTAIAILYPSLMIILCGYSRKQKPKVKIKMTAKCAKSTLACHSERSEESTLQV